MSTPALAHDSNCDNSATDGSSIHCEEDSTSTEAITIDVDGVNISTSGNREAGIKAEHAGGTATTPANITIDVTGTSTNNTISTSNGSADGIRGEHSGTGNVDIDTEGITITTDSAGSAGIRGQHSGTGNVDIDVEDVTVTIMGTGSDAGGIHSQHSGTGNIDIDATEVSISTAGTDAEGTDVSAEGVDARHTGTGNITIDISGTTTTPSTITTTTTRSHGIVAEQNPAMGKMGGDIDITLGNTQIETDGESATGLSIVQRGALSSGAITATLNSGVTITTEGEDAYGVLLDHKGNVSNTSRDVTLTAGKITVRTKGENAFGFWVRRQDGDGDVTINADGSEIITEDNGAIGIHAYHVGDDNDGDITIDVRNGSITTGSVVEEGGTSTSKGYGAHGIYARHQNRAPSNTVGTGDVRIETRNFDITTTGTDADPRFGALGATVSFGIAAVQEKTGDISIIADGGSVSTAGAYSYGLQGDHKGDGDVDIETRNGHTITTMGSNSSGIVAFHFGTTDMDRQIDITVGGPVTVSGAGARGVVVGTVNSAGVPSRMAALNDMGYRRQTVTVNGPITSAAEGVYLANGGRVTIGPRGSISSTKGIAILATGTVPDPDATDPNTAAIPPKLYVDLDLDGRRIMQVIGDDWIINDGGETTIEVNDVVLHHGDTGVALDENGDPRVVANGAWDIYMLANGVKVTDRSNADPAMWTVSTRAAGVISDRDFSASDFTETRVRCPAGQTGFPNCRGPSPPPEPEPEAMQVNEEIVADEDEMAAVHIEGDGAVHIGAQGSLRAASGIAILASGTTPELTVDLDLDGRTVGQVIGDDWIINDGGGTTINVNGVTLHDATTGVVPDAVAPNGAYNTRINDEVRIRAEGVRVTDRSDPDPANWTLTEPVEGVIADRDFSAADFIATQTGTGPEPTPPMFIEEYAPRAAVYEALPSVLLGLHERTSAAPRSRQPTWLTVTGHTGSQDFGRSTVGSEYDIDTVQVEAGKHFTLASGTEAWATLQYLDGTAEVGSPVQGGDIDVQGLNVSLELCRGCQNNADTYVSGSVSLGRYDLDLDSDTRGNLKQGVGATAYALALEAGQRLQRTTYHLIPRLRFEHASVSIDRFTDAVDARVSYPDADRLAIALGVRAETAPRPQKKDGLSLWGSLDLEHRLDDAQTTARVSGTRLKTESGDNSILLGLGASWQRDRLSLNAGLSAREGLDGGSESYGATLDLSLQF